MDLFLGLEQVPDPLEALFDAPDGLCPDVKISAVAPDLEAVRRSRADQSARLFGPHVLEVCALADLVFLGLHGQDGEDGRIQAAFDLLGIRYTGGGYLGSGMAMDKSITKMIMDQVGIPNAPWRNIPHYTEADIPQPDRRAGSALCGEGGQRAAPRWPCPGGHEGRAGPSAP